MGDGLFVQKRGTMGRVFSAEDDEHWMLARFHHVRACVHACMCCTYACITTLMIDLPQAVSYRVATICCMVSEHSARRHEQTQHSLQLLSAETPCLNAMAYAYVTSGAKGRRGQGRGGSSSFHHLPDTRHIMRMHRYRHNTKCMTYIP